MVWICIETADSTASSSLLNSSKQPHAPHLMIPMKILPILFTSIPCIEECIGSTPPLQNWKVGSHLVTVEDKDLSSKEPTESLH